MSTIHTVEHQLQDLDIKAKVLLSQLRMASENDVLLLVDELNGVALLAAQLAFGEKGLEWLSDRLEMLIWKTDHLDEPGMLDRLVSEIRSGAFQ